MIRLLQFWRAHLQVIDRLLVIVFAVWILVLTTVLVFRRPAPAIFDERSDVVQKIDEIHRWSMNALAPTN